MADTTGFTMMGGRRAAIVGEVGICGSCAVFAGVQAIGGDVAMVCGVAEVGCESEAWTPRS